MNNNSRYLHHSGVLGMKWGIRRYQNKDGSLTPEGKKRYAHDVSENSKRKKDKRLPQDGLEDPKRWVREDLSRSKNLAESSNRLVNDLKYANSSRKNKRTRMDLSSMSDKELRDRINRELLERQYNDVFNQQKVSKGKVLADTILSGAGTALTLSASALGVALAIKELR